MIKKGFRNISAMSEHFKAHGFKTTVVVGQQGLYLDLLDDRGKTVFEITVERDQNFDIEEMWRVGPVRFLGFHESGGSIEESVQAFLGSEHVVMATIK